MVIPCGITASVSAQDKENLFSECDKFIQQLKEAGIRCRGDFRDKYTPGWKFNHWELKVQKLSVSAQNVHLRVPCAKSAV